LHSTLTVTTDGVPLGILGAQCTAPAPRDKDGHRASSAMPIQEKKTFAWIMGLRQCNDLAASLPDARLNSVMDREADFFELFDEQRQSGPVDLLVRANHDRATGEDVSLFEFIRQRPVQGQLRIHVPRQSARAKKSKHRARAGHEERGANVDLRHREI
jgi:hypothetical protein